MKLLSSGRRGEVYLVEGNGKIFTIKKAKDETKKGSIQREIAILKYLKGKADFVPQILDSGEDWFKYEFIPGQTLDKFSKSSPDSDSIVTVYRKLIDYAYKLDLLNVEHGELSCPTKNIIVNFPEVFIIDFERGNLMNKNFKNLRSIGQFLLGLGIIDKGDLKFSNPEKFKDFLTKRLDLL